MSEELKPPQFPTMLRKMWSGSEVQAWIDDNWNRRAQPEPAAPARTLLEQYDLEQSADYRKGYEDGRLKGYEVGHRHATDTAPSVAPEPVALQSVELTRDTNGMCVVKINGRVAIEDNGDVISHFATLGWFAHPPRAPLTDAKWCADWLRNNYQRHLTIASLCEHMISAAHSISAAPIDVTKGA